MSLLHRNQASLPLILLGLLILLHLVLALEFHQQRGFYLAPADGSDYALTLDFLRYADGYVQSGRFENISPGPVRLFTGERKESQELTLSTLWHELTQGLLRGLWRNHPHQDSSLFYSNEFPHQAALAALVYMLSGGSITATTLTPQFYLAILLLSVYGLGRRLADPWVGIAAAAIASGYISIFGMARTHHGSVALAALSVALVYLLFRSDGFRNLGSVLAAGVVAFLTMRSGESITRTLLVGVVVLFPFLFAMRRMVANGRRDRGAAIRGATGLAIFLFMVVSVFEWARIEAFFASVNDSKLDDAAYPHFGQHFSPFFAALLWYLAYPIEIAFRLVRPVMTLWFLAGLLFFLRRPVGARRIAVGLMFLAPLIMLTLFNRKGDWYIPPLLPPMALLTALGLARIKRSRLRGIALGLASSCGIFVLCFHTIASPGVQRGADLETIAPAISNAVRINGIDLLRYKTLQQEAMHSDSALKFVEHVRLNPPPAGEVRMVAMLASHEDPAQAFRYNVELREPRIFLVDLLNVNLLEETYPELAKVDFDYLIYVDDRGLTPWVEDVTTSEFFTRLGSTSTGRPWPKDLSKIIESLRTRQWEQIDLAGRPIYRRTDSERSAH